MVRSSERIGVELRDFLKEKAKCTEEHTGEDLRRISKLT